MSNKINLIIVHGSLGAGKTTFVNSLLQSNQLEDLIIIENEFANESIDKDLLSTNSVVEINGKCICCNLEDDLEKILVQIAGENKYKNVLIETTGVASFAKLIQRLFLYKFFNKYFNVLQVIMLLDATIFKSKVIDEEFNINIKLSDLVLLNKSDLVSKEDLDVVTSKLTSINAKYVVTINSQTNIKISELRSQIEEKFFANIEWITKLKLAHDDYSYFIHNAKQDINLFTIKDLPVKFPEIERIKGFFQDGGNYFEVSLASKDLKIKELSKKTETKIVFIGKQLNSLALSNYLNNNL